MEAATEKKLIVIAHFDAAGILSKDWLALLALLKHEAFADLVLVSTGLNAERYQEHLAGVRVIVRENIGYDFYSWRQGILDSSPERYGELILINSSFFVPDAQKFSDVLRQPMPQGAQIRGLTVSWQCEFHAQSYFLQFSREVIGSSSFQSFWRDMQPISERNDVIANYELGLSKALGKEFRIEPIFPVGPYEKFLFLRRGLKDPSWVNGATLDHGYEQFKSAFNPSLMLWDALLFRYGIVKKQFVTQNPFNWPIDELRSFVGGCVIV